MSLRRVADVDVRDFAPVGRGGDDSPALQAAADAAFDLGGAVVYAPTPLTLDSQVTFRPGVYLRGAGRNKTKITLRGVPAGQAGLRWLNSGEADFQSGGGCQHLSVYATADGQGCLLFEGTEQHEIRDVYIQGHVLNPYTESNRLAEYGIRIAGGSEPAEFCRVDHFYIYGCKTAFHIRGQTDWEPGNEWDTWSNRHTITGGNVQTSSIGVHFEGWAASTTHMTCDVQSCDVGIKFTNARYNIIETQIENCPVPLQSDAASTRNWIRGQWPLDNSSLASPDGNRLDTLENGVRWTEANFRREVGHKVQTSVGGNAGASRSLFFGNGTVADVTLDQDTQFTISTTNSRVASGTEYRMRLITRHTGGFTPTFTNTILWPTGWPKSPWPTGRTIVDFITTDGGASYVALILAEGAA